MRIYQPYPLDCIVRDTSLPKGVISLSRVRDKQVVIYLAIKHRYIWGSNENGTRHAEALHMIFCESSETVQPLIRGNLGSIMRLSFRRRREKRWETPGRIAGLEALGIHLGTGSNNGAFVGQNRRHYWDSNRDISRNTQDLFVPAILCPQF